MLALVHVAAVGRRVTAVCTSADGVRQPLALYQTSSPFCLLPASLPQPLPQPVSTKGTGAAKAWRSSTSAIAAGLTDRVRTLREMALCAAVAAASVSVGTEGRWESARGGGLRGQDTGGPDA